jgi:hypothetical protein
VSVGPGGTEPLVAKVIRDTNTIQFRFDVGQRFNQLLLVQLGPSDRRDETIPH